MGDFAYTQALPSKKCQHLHNWETCFGLLIKVFIVFWEVIQRGLMGSCVENSSENGDKTKLIGTQRLSKHGFATASIKWLRKIYLNSVHQNVNACQRARVDLDCIVYLLSGVYDEAELLQSHPPLRTPLKVC